MNGLQTTIENNSLLAQQECKTLQVLPLNQKARSTQKEKTPLNIWGQNSSKHCL